MFNITVDKAQNGFEAVKLYKKDLEKTCGCKPMYSLIFMDLNMPIMDGYDASVEIYNLAFDHERNLKKNLQNTFY